MSSPTTFDPAFTGPVAVLSAGNRILAPTDAQNCSRLNRGYDAAGGLKLYWEFQCISTSAFGNNFPGVGLSPVTDASFSGNGANGIVATMTGGYQVYDDAVSTFIAFHGGGTYAFTQVSRFGGSPVGTAIGIIWDTAAGTFSVYSINVAGSTRTLAAVLSVPTTGIWFPCYGSGTAGPMTESYQENTSNAQFHMAKPVGTIAYEDAVNPPAGGQLLTLFG